MGDETMKNTIIAEANVLERIMRVLEEESVTYLVQKDNRFAEFIDGLYSAVNDQSRSLRDTAQVSGAVGIH
jgi:hypothetical protein